MSKPALSQLSVVTNVILLGCLLFLLIRVAHGGKVLQQRKL